jgi:hypothetical protein
MPTGRRAPTERCQQLSSDINIDRRLFRLIAHGIYPWRKEAACCPGVEVFADLDVQYKTAVVLAHKLREAVAR